MEPNRVEPGDIKVNGIHIINAAGKRVDVTRLMVQLDLHEDIMHPFVTGSLMLSDSVGLAEILPFIGEEMLVIDLETPGFDHPLMKRTAQFFIYKMGERENAALKNVVYTLYFISVEGFTDINSRLSMKYTGNVGEITKKLVTGNPGLKSQKNILVEATTNNEVYVSNFWTPSQNIYYLTSRATNSKGNPSYVFFEGNEGFVFASLERLYEGAVVGKFTRSSKTRAPGSVQDLDEEYGKVLDMSTPVFFDYLQRVQGGFYGGSAYRMDIETKRINFRNLVARDEIKTSQLNKYKVQSTDQLQFHPDVAMTMEVTHRDLFTNGAAPLTVTHHNRRMALLQQLSALTTNIQVFGRLDYSVGKVYELEAYVDRPIDDKTTEPDLIDKVLSGRYLLTSLHHQITTESHLCDMELSKESMLKSLYEY